MILNDTTGSTMNTLYDSESFAVVHMAADVPSDKPQTKAQPMLSRQGFEIVDKRNGKEVYLDGYWAELFQQHITQWQLKTPTQDEVEDTLAQYAELAQNPVVMH